MQIQNCSEVSECLLSISVLISLWAGNPLCRLAAGHGPPFEKHGLKRHRHLLSHLTSSLESVFPGWVLQLCNLLVFPLWPQHLQVSRFVWVHLKQEGRRRRKKGLLCSSLLLGNETFPSNSSATSRNFPLHFICQNWVSWPQLHQQLAERSIGCHWFLPWCCMSGVPRRKWGFCEWREGAMAGYVTSSICHTENRGPFGSLSTKLITDLVL